MSSLSPKKPSPSKEAVSVLQSATQSPSPSLPHRHPLQTPTPKFPLCPQTETTKHLPIVTLDHCNSCRRASGSIVECWMILPQSWIKFSLLQHFPQSTLNLSTKGREETRFEPEVKDVLSGEKGVLEQSHLRHFQSSVTGNRTFCGRCGTGVTFFHNEKPKGDFPEHLDVKVGTLDRKSMELVRATRESWVGDRIGWVGELLVGNGV